MKKYNTLYTKIYFEEYARVCLKYLFNFKLIIRKGRYGEDRPDLISQDEKIGVEVTQGITEEEGRQNKLFQQEYPKDKTRNKAIKREAERLKVEDDLSFIDDIACMTIINSLEISLKGILGVFKKKIKKLNEATFNIYDSNYLFIFAGNLFPSDITEVANIILKEQKKNVRRFDKIFLLNLGDLYIIEKWDYVKINISRDKLKKIKEKALTLAKTKKE